MKAREGDLLETLDGNIFDVKGLVHPLDKIVAFIRFTPDPMGERRRGNVRYRKIYPLEERYALLRERFPQYLVFDPVFGQWLCEVPIELVNRHHEPSSCLSQLRHKSALDVLRKQAVDFAQLLHAEAGVKWDALGISGSLLVGLHTDKSDVDLVVHGSENARKIHSTLESLLPNSIRGVKPYNKQDLRALFGFRSKDTQMKFEDFVRTESRKVLQGKFKDSDYYIRCVKDWKEVAETYGLICYKPLGEVTVSATVVDDSQMIFTPCTYGIEHVHIVEGKKLQLPCEVVSFRGRFCEQARKGERIIARGMIERLKGTSEPEHFRLVVGNVTSDFMILAD